MLKFTLNKIITPVNLVNGDFVMCFIKFEKNLPKLCPNFTICVILWVRPAFHERFQKSIFTCTIFISFYFIHPKLLESLYIHFYLTFCWTFSSIKWVFFPMLLDIMLLTLIFFIVFSQWFFLFTWIFIHCKTF